jgi:hypothetical protein
LPKLNSLFLIFISKLFITELNSRNVLFFETPDQGVETEVLKPHPENIILDFRIYLYLISLNEILNPDIVLIYVILIPLIR